MFQNMQIYYTTEFGGSNKKILESRGAFKYDEYFRREFLFISFYGKWLKLEMLSIKVGDFFNHYHYITTGDTI